MFSTLIQVAAGGAIGASGRFLVGHWAGRVLGPGLPWATLLVNVGGSFLMGIVFALLSQRPELRLAPFLMTGVLGGFTTFSAFSLDVLVLHGRGETVLGVLYITGSVGLSIAALFLGVAAMRGMLG